MTEPTAKRTLILSFLLLLTAMCTAQSVWEPTGGPTGGTINALTAHNGTLYVGTFVGGMFQSTDQGETWSRLGISEVFERVEDFATNSQGDLFGGSTHGVRRSTDGGATWELFTEGLTTRYVRGLAVNADDVLFAGTAGGGVFRSEDSGETWLEANNGLTELSCSDVAIGPEGNVYVSTNNGVFASEDNGENWTDISAGLTSTFVQGLFVDADAALWAATLPGPFKRANSTSDFERSYHLSVNVIDTTSSGTLIGGGPVILRSMDGGASWTEHQFRFDEIFTNALEIARAGDRLVMGSSPRGPYVSDDDGQTWVLSREGFVASVISSMAADADGVLYAGSFQGVFRSSDRGDTWEHLVSIGRNNVESLLVTSSGLVVAGTNNNGIHISSDGGDTWSPVDTTFAMRGAPSLAEAPNGDLYAGGSDESVLRSTDGWATWDTVDTGPMFDDVQAVGVSPSGTVLAATNENLRRSTDGGDTWEDAVTGLPEPPDVRDFEFMPNGDILAADFEGVFRSGDEGATWELTGERPGFGLTSIARTGENLFVTIRGLGVSFSEDGGETWTSVNEGLEIVDATSLLFQPQSAGKQRARTGKSIRIASDVLFVGTRGGGVSRMVSVPTNVTQEIPEARLFARLGRNYPNPFTGKTTFLVRLARPAEVKTTLLDILGRTVQQHGERTLPTGESELRVEASGLPAGVYVYRVDFGDRVETRLVSVAR